MAKVVKVIELMSQSPESWEDAAQGAVKEATKTLRNIRSIYGQGIYRRSGQRENHQLSHQRKSHI